MYNVLLMEKWIKHCSWEASRKLVPRLLSVMGFQRDAERFLTRNVHPFWALDCDFEGVSCYRFSSRGSLWQQRAPKVVHLYPPHTSFWERNRLPLAPYVRGCYIIFVGGYDCGLGRFIARPFRYARFQDPDGAIGSRLLAIADVGAKEGPQGFWKAQALFLEILAALHRSRHVEGETYRIHEQIETEPATDFVKAVQEYLSRHMRETVRVKDLASEFHMSLSAFAHRYSKEGGKTPLETLIAMRIHLAKGLLLRGHTLKDIAEQTGFSDAFHLSKTFKRATGQSPRDYISALR